MSVLERILADKQAEVAERSKAVPLARLRERAARAAPPRSLSEALSPRAARERRKGDGFRVIAEVKKASPSRGVIREDFDAPSIAQSFERAGAAAISVLTDEKYFQGRLEFLEAIRSAVGLPLLRKDFIIDPYQVWESRAAGADAILLILAAVPGDVEIAALAREAEGLGMDVLWEVHDSAELRRLIPLEPKIVGINNRNLRTFEVTLETTRNLLPEVPPGVVTVSESGFFRREELEAMQGWGVHGFLVGESLLKAPDPGAALELLTRPRKGAVP